MKTFCYEANKFQFVLSQTDAHATKVHVFYHWKAIAIRDEIERIQRHEFLADTPMLHNQIHQDSLSHVYVSRAQTIATDLLHVKDKDNEASLIVIVLVLFC